MADGIFSSAKFGRSAAELRQIKIRIVAEAVGPAWSVDNFAVPAAFGNERFRIFGAAHAPSRSNNRVAVGLVHQHGEQLPVVAGVLAVTSAEDPAGARWQTAPNAPRLAARAATQMPDHRQARKPVW